MSENRNVEAVVDSKPEAPPEKPPEAAVPSIPSVLSNEHSLGEIMTMARETRGLSREQAAIASNIPGYYLTMIETDDYSSIADQLYLLPFLRRYATFVGLEAEEVASRFIRDVQRADMNPGRAAEPIAMFEPRKPIPWRVIMTIATTAVVIAIAWYGYRHFVARKSATANATAPVTAEQIAPDAEPVDPKTANTVPAQDAQAPASMPSVAVAPAAVAPAVIPPAAIPHPATSAPLGASAPNSVGHPAAKPSSFSASRSSNPRPRVPLKTAPAPHRLSMQN